MTTIKQHIDAAIDGINELDFKGSRRASDRELFLAITHLEDAQMRVTRALAMNQGKFAPVDLQA